MFEMNRRGSTKLRTNTHEECHFAAVCRVAVCKPPKAPVNWRRKFRHQDVFVAAPQGKGLVSA